MDGETSVFFTFGDVDVDDGAVASIAGGEGDDSSFAVEEEEEDRDEEEVELDVVVDLEGEEGVGIGSFELLLLVLPLPLATDLLAGLLDDADAEKRWSAKDPKMEEVVQAVLAAISGGGACI